jgi:hypothetical protein
LHLTSQLNTRAQDEYKIVSDGHPDGAQASYLPGGKLPVFSNSDEEAV